MVTFLKKEMLKRGLLGIPLGITWDYLITIVISLGWGNGNYLACVPSLAESMGGEAYAVLVQALLCGVAGAVFGASSVIWELETWSIVKQTGIYFLIAAVNVLPIAYLMHWMEHSLKGVISYALIFVLIFVCVWISQYIAWKVKVKKINAKLSQ